MNERTLEARLATVNRMSPTDRQVLLGCLVGVVTDAQWAQVLASVQQIERDTRAIDADRNLL